MRAYFFGNMYLSSIQQGIQSAHCLSEMFVKYQYRSVQVIYPPSHPSQVLSNWAKNHKTMILLNGGYASNLDEIAKFFARKQNPYPWARFKEEEASLNKATTCVGIVLPEKVYEASKKWRMSISQEEKDDALKGFSYWEVFLATDVLPQYSLAH